MIRRFAAWTVLAAAAVLLPVAPGAQRRVEAPVVKRLSRSPLIGIGTSPSLGDDINGPTVIRVPDWVDHPLGRYYMYFAHHMGRFIRLAYADAVDGPWRVYEPGVLPVSDTAFFRPQPDPVENLENFYTHVASPEIDIDAPNRRLIMWFHGWWTDGRMWPVGEPAARAWARQHGYGQYSQAATSTDGLHWQVQPAITHTSYMRVFRRGATYFAMARLGRLFRSTDPLASFEAGPNPFRDTPYAGRVRHVGIAQHGDRLDVFFTAIGDAPERVMFTTIDLTGDWTSWKVSDPVDVLRPERDYECTTLPDVPSEAGDVKGPVRQIRDPYLFEDQNRTYLFYSYCGEQGIAAATLSER
jgi:hypothetical protein